MKIREFFGVVFIENMMEFEVSLICAFKIENYS
jgi:hypothetical protein